MKRTSGEILQVQSSKSKVAPSREITFNFHSHTCPLSFHLLSESISLFLSFSSAYRSGNEDEGGQTENMLRTLEASKKGCSTIALLPTTRNIPILAIAYEILRCYEPFGKSNSQQYTHLADLNCSRLIGIGRILRLEDSLRQFGPDALSRSNDYLVSSWLAVQEETHGLVIYVVRQREPPPFSIRIFKLFPFSQN